MDPNSKSGSFFRNQTKAVPPNFKVISEGCADVIFEDEKEVFYNNVQVINRDLSCLVIQQFIRDTEFEKYDILEALAATGLRSIRYWKEIEGLNTVTCNDLESAAFESIRRNVIHNEISTEHVKPNLGDCNHVMYDAFRNKKPFEVVDLDPYGSAIPFLASGLKAVRNGGLLCVTCTDLAVLCGSQKGASFGQYGLFPVKKKHCHELALRSLLTAIQRMASTEKKYIEPLLCLFIDFYVRVFIRVRTSPKTVKGIHKKHGYMFSCSKCAAFKFIPMSTAVSNSGQVSQRLPQSVCEECDFNTSLCGPVWTGPLHDPPFLTRLLSLIEERGPKKIATYPRCKGLVTIAKEEVDTPLFYHLPNICASLRCSCPKSVIIKSALLHLGYNVSRTHCHSDGIKTDAPSKVVLDIFRAYVKGLGKGYGNLEKKPDLAKTIMSKEIKTENINFSLHPSIRHNSGKKKVKAFFPNPERFWGPKSRAKGDRKKKKKKEPSVAVVVEEEEEEEIEEKNIVGKKRKREDIIQEEKEIEEEEDGESPMKKSKTDN